MCNLVFLLTSLTHLWFHDNDGDDVDDGGGGGKLEGNAKGRRSSFGGPTDTGEQYLNLLKNLATQLDVFQGVPETERRLNRVTVDFSALGSSVLRKHIL